jgi:hypothetical protein
MLDEALGPISCSMPSSAELPLTLKKLEGFAEVSPYRNST